MNQRTVLIHQAKDCNATPITLGKRNQAARSNCSSSRRCHRSAHRGSTWFLLSRCKYRHFSVIFQVFLRETYEGGTSLHHDFFAILDVDATLGRVAVDLAAIDGVIHIFHLTSDIFHRYDSRPSSARLLIDGQDVVGI